MEENVATNPLEVGFFCAIGVVLEPDGIADLVEKFWGGVGFPWDLTSDFVVKP
jgi:hypothetical protein